MECGGEAQGLNQGVRGGARPRPWRKSLGLLGRLVVLARRLGALPHTAAGGKAAPCQIRLDAGVGQRMIVGYAVVGGVNFVALRLYPIAHERQDKSTSRRRAPLCLPKERIKSDAAALSCCSNALLISSMASLVQRARFLLPSSNLSIVDDKSCNCSSFKRSSASSVS